MARKNKKNKVQVQVKNEDKSQSKSPVEQLTKHPIKTQIFLSSDDESLHSEPIVSANELKSSPLPIPVIPRVESKNIRVESVEIDYLQRDQKSSGKIPSHWLDVSMLDTRTPLIFEAFDQDGKLENGRKTKSIFKTLYNKFGSHESEIILIGVESDHIRLYFENGKSRYKIKEDLDFIIAHENEDLNLSVFIPILTKPSIQFISSSNIKEKKKFECLSNIKDSNNWPDETVLIFVESIPLENTGKFKVKITVDSCVRSLIEKQRGIIIDHSGVKVEVMDDLNLLRCQKCYDFGHLKSDCKRVRSKCFYCSQVLHPGPCPIKFYPNLWYCGFCKKRGHSGISKDCPYLMKVLKNKLEEMDHKYRYVILDRDLGRDVCDFIVDQNGKRSVEDERSAKDSSSPVKRNRRSKSMSLGDS